MSAEQQALDKFRVAMKFSLWAWALYWPGGGLLLLLGGLNPVSIIVTLVSLGAFIALLVTGAVSPTSSRNMKQFLLERPLYFIVILLGLALLAPLFAPVETGGLFFFAAVWFAGSVFALVRLAQYQRVLGGSPIKRRTDQAFIALGLAAFGSFIVFADAIAGAANATPVSGPPMTVALINWLNLLYPPLLLVATVGLREPLRNPRMPTADDAPTPAAKPDRA